MKFPKYLIRPSDHAIFVLVKNSGGQYRVDCSGPEWSGNTYPYDMLVDYGWYPCGEDSLKKEKELHKEYVEFLKWTCRPDGHGGVEGGTMEEYLKFKKSNKNGRKKNGIGKRGTGKTPVRN